MKKLLLLAMCMILTASVVSAAAQITSNQDSISLSAKPTKAISTSFVITNNGTTNLTSLTSTLSTSELSTFNISISPSSFDLNTGATQTITVTGTIPEDVNTRLSPFSGSIIVSNAAVSKSVTLDLTATSQLVIDSVKVVVDGDSDSVDDGDTVRDVKPGSKIIIKGDIENIFTDDEDITIEDVEVEITGNDLDDDDDLEEEDDLGDIDADEKESFRIEFTLDEDIDEDEYEITIEVTTDDENGAKHSVEIEFTLDVEKDKHDIVIQRSSVSPSKISCARTATINVNLKNQGRTDEDEVVVRIESPDLDIDLDDVSIPELEEGTGSDTEISKSYSFKIKENVAVSTYPVTIKAYYDTDTLSDIEAVDIVVEECTRASTSTSTPTPVTTTPTTTPDDTVVIIQQPSTSTNDLGIITTPFTETTESSVSTPILLALGGFGIVAIIVIIVLFVVVMDLKKKV